jgi:hypothetical protein
MLCKDCAYWNPDERICQHRDAPKNVEAYPSDSCDGFQRRRVVLDFQGEEIEFDDEV